MLHPSKDQLKILLTIAVMLLITTAIVVSVVSTSANSQSKTLDELQHNHDASLCVLAVTHQISAASGKSADESRRIFQLIFSDDWLMGHCGLTREESDRIISGV